MAAAKGPRWFVARFGDDGVRVEGFTSYSRAVAAASIVEVTGGAYEVVDRSGRVLFCSGNGADVDRSVARVESDFRSPGFFVPNEAGDRFVRESVKEARVRRVGAAMASTVVPGGVLDLVEEVRVVRR